MPRRGRDRRGSPPAAGERRHPARDQRRLYLTTARPRPLQDVVTCIREKRDDRTAGRLLAANAERHLKSPAEMARLFERWPHAIEETLQLARPHPLQPRRARYEYPQEPVPPGWTPQGWLEHLVMEGRGKALPGGVPDKVAEGARRGARADPQADYARYFLTVHDIVRFRAIEPADPVPGARLGRQLRGLLLLGITSVDPVDHDLLFERFISEERHEPPDIDVDFEHERREEVMQYVYENYGRDRAGIAATVIHYRPRTAIREVGKALGLTEDVTARLAYTIWGSWTEACRRALGEAGLDPANPTSSGSITSPRS